MTWHLNLSRTALKQLVRLDKESQRRIRKDLKEKLLKSPMIFGRQLRGKKFAGLCRFRVGDYRVVYGLEYKPKIIMVVGILKRGDDYKD